MFDMIEVCMSRALLEEPIPVHWHLLTTIFDTVNGKQRPEYMNLTQVKS